MSYKKIVIAGGTGFLGKLLLPEILNIYDEVVVLTRKRAIGTDQLRYVTWDAKTFSGWESELDGADVLINLTGKCVDCRYTETNKLKILNSRLNATHILQKAVDACVYPPKVWLNASSATIYRDATDREQSETSGELGEGFSVEVCKEWEKAFFTSVKNVQTRKIALRIGIVISNKGGAFPKLKTIAQMGVKWLGSGAQKMSWIHEKDFVRGIFHLIHHPTLEGSINLTSPQPLTNKQFIELIHQKYSLPSLVSIPQAILEFGAFFIRTETELILKSRWVVPSILLQSGFTFELPDWKHALQNL